LDKPVQIAGRQLAGLFEDFGGAAIHGKIVESFRNARGIFAPLPRLPIRRWPAAVQYRLR
jgi:hypothetical protein